MRGEKTLINALGLEKPSVQIASNTNAGYLAFEVRIGDKNAIGGVEDYLVGTILLNEAAFEELSLSIHRIKTKSGVIDI